MFEFFDDSKTYVFPSGKRMTGAEIKETGTYPLTTSAANCVVNVVGGIVNSFGVFESLAEQHGLSDDASIDELNEAIKKASQNAQYTSEMNNAVFKIARMTAMTFTDEQALEVKDIYDPFEVGRSYKKDEFFTYNGELFKVVKDHTSEEQWVPGESGTESLYTKITLNDAGHPIWKQPTGAHDAYNIGDIVEYNGQLYKSKIDGNTYAPDAYPAGWEIYVEE